MKKIFLLIAMLIIFVLALIYLYLGNTAPQYSGTIINNSVKDSTEVIYDKYGIPHIYAKSGTDAYFALGFTQAQERLFQMVMLRRLSRGKLAEILGPKLIEIDKRMITLGFNEFAAKNTKAALEFGDKEMISYANAYQKGINSFIDNGNLPIEFTMLGFKPEHFIFEDIYTTLGYMALGFTTGITSEPVMQYIHETLGNDYSILFEADTAAGNINYHPHAVKEIIANNIISEFNAFPYDLPFPYWEGSNSWLLSKERSKSGKAIFANDTHIGYSQPSVWFEAYMEYPGFDFYGYYLAGMPFAIIGHNPNLAWGITIFPMDNMDLYYETTNPENSNQYLQANEWRDYTIIEHIIKVKDSTDVVYNVKISERGPILTDAFNQTIQKEGKEVSLWWPLYHIKSDAVQATFIMNNARNITEFAKAMPMIDILGLNIMYADIDDNIAWWATGLIPKRTAGLSSKKYMDGATDTLAHEFYPFDKNPKLINPERGYIISANNSPGMYDSLYVPGYYSPGYRAERIEKLITSQEKWNIEELKAVQTDVFSERDLRLVNIILDNIYPVFFETEEAKQLQIWDGNYNIESVGATIFTRLLYEVLAETFIPKLGEKRFSELLHTYALKANIERLISDPNSIWFSGEMSKVCNTAWSNTVGSLHEQLGDDLQKWNWGRVHQIEHVHAIGRKKPFNKVFNVGPIPKSGSNEVIDKEGFTYGNKKSIYIKSGPALRYFVDFAKPKNGIGIIPTGQSGNIMSPHYSDQAQMFVDGEYRAHIMNKDELPSNRILWIVNE